MSLPVKEILSIAEKRLDAHGDKDAKVDAKDLYCFMMNIGRNDIVLEYQNTLQDVLCDRYFELIDRRCAGEPTQYITSSQHFMGLDFFVDSRVLIPRMDTEAVVERATSIIEEEQRNHRRSFRILDLCTGSGAIGLSIARLYKDAEVILTDISKDAIEVAKINADRLGLRKKVDFRTGDLFSPFKGFMKKQKFDLIISNPPYVPTETIETLQTEIRDFEPKSALDGGDDGLDFYRRVIAEAHLFMKKSSHLILEIGDNQGDAVKELMKAEGTYTDIEIGQDLSGRNRMVVCRLRQS